MTKDEFNTALNQWEAAKHDPLAHRRFDKQRRVEKKIIFTILKEFNPEDLACVADSLRDCHESKTNVGSVEVEADTMVETDTAYASRFIRRYLEILEGNV